MAVRISRTRSSDCELATIADEVAYEAGVATDEFIEEIPYRETRHYVKRVLGNLWAYGALYDGGPLTLPENVPVTYLEEPSF